MNINVRNEYYQLKIEGVQSFEPICRPLGQHQELTLPLEMFQNIINGLNSRDHVSISLVSRLWRYLAFNPMRVQEDRLCKLLIRNLAAGFGEWYPGTRDRLIKIDENIAISSSKNYQELEYLLLKARSEVIEILRQKQFEISKLENSLIMKKNRCFFIHYLLSLNILWLEI